jgi:iron complex outermembrane recepter protein
MNIRTSTSTAALVAASLGMSLLASHAQAQTASAIPPAKALSTAVTAADQSGIADIVVTATRRKELLQKTAIPVTAITGDVLAAKGVTNVQALTAVAPSLKIAQSGGGGLQITTRGVGNLGANNFNEPGVAINYDGIYLARSFGANGIFFDVARVEVLKGPQGTLYGRNSTGGVLNIITNDPTNELGGNLTVDIGNYGMKRASGAINVPISDTVALRIAAQGVERDGYLTDGYNDEKAFAGRVKLKIDPTANLSILLEANYASNKGKGIAYVFSPYVDPANPYVGPSDARSNAIIAAVPGLGPILPKIGTDGFQDNKSRQFIGTVNYDLGGAKATLILANTRNTLNYKFYTPGFPVSDDTRATPNYYTTAELRLASDGNGSLKWVVGGFFYKEDFPTNAFVNQGFTFADSRKVAIHTNSYSGFGEVTYAITPQIRLTTGGRYTSDDKKIDGTTLNPLGTPPVCNAPGVVTVDAVRGNVCSVDDIGAAKFSKFTYKVGIDADVGPNSLVYATYSTGFKSGGFFASANYNAAGAFPSNAYRPETISAFTIGSKNRFLNNKLQVNFEGFYWKYKDKQVSHLGFVPPNNQILVVDNAGNATVYGAELDIQWRPTRNDDFGINLQYLNTNYDSFSYSALVAGWARPFAPGTPAPVPLTGCSFTPTVGVGGAARGTGRPGLSTIDCTGRKLSMAPEWSLNVSYKHTFDLSDGSTIVPAVSTNIESGFWFGEDYFAGQYQESFMMSAASLTWNSADKKFSVAAYVNNIEDKAVGQTASLNGTIGKVLVSLRPPRTFGARLNVRF